MRAFPRGLASDTPKPMWVFHRHFGACYPDRKWVFPRRVAANISRWNQLFRYLDQLATNSFNEPSQQTSLAAQFHLFLSQKGSLGLGSCFHDDLRS